MILIQDELKCIADKIKTKLCLDNLLYMYSPIDEFHKKLTATKDKPDKYPLFFLNSDNVRKEGDVWTVGDIIVATLSNKDFNREKRDEYNVKQVLIPIYEEMLRRLTFDKHLSLYKEGRFEIKYGKTFFEGGAEVPDFVDAIHLKNFQFRIQECKIIKTK